MKLVFIYGPPAVGKLTVANELSKLSKYKIFHNHLVGDLLYSLFGFNTPQYRNLSIKFRLEMIKAATEDDTSFIMTFCYSYKKFDSFIKKIIKNVESANGKIYFIQIICDKSELFKRVKAESRKKYTKVTSIDKLKNTLKEWDMFKAIPYVKSLTIDNTNLSAKKVAEKIHAYIKK
ncbi:AAA family ATPase [Nanoarchaeota archaeon]